MARFTVTFDADLDDPRNQYDDSDFANIGEAVQANDVKTGTSVYLEFGTGDAVRATLVSIEEVTAR